MSVKETIIKYAVAYYYGVRLAALLLIGFICKPSEFRVKERTKPPKCLKDEALGVHGYLTLKGVKIHYVEKGDRSKPLMLFLHGFPEFWYSWRYQMKEFSKDYWTVAIDQRGYGDSEKPSGVKNYDIDLLVEDVKQTVEALGRQKFILVAHDWGGLVAWNFVAKHHHMLEKYIIMDAPYTTAWMNTAFTNKKQFKCSWYVFFYILPYLPELMFSAFDFRAFAIVFRRKKSKDVSPVSDDDIEAYKYTFGKPGALTPPINYYRHFMSSKSADDEIQVIDIDVPGLLIFGEFDDYLIPESVPITQQYVKKLETRTVKGGNHFVQQDEPEAVNRYITEFLQK
ncbi:epoxide hydrolase 1-like [Periplaneta americana]|uniref:epoxide hydrolase 1-like n=1 Tax=Periplaneta americana TaxID=6978 RepID=UPI0037E81D2A